VNIKILVCQVIGPAAAGSAGPVPTPVHSHEEVHYVSYVLRASH